jgi:anti-sigma factor RsiW
MCNISAKLIVWFDCELPIEEAADVERHLQTCAECRSELDTYKRLSGALESYCEAALASGAPGRARQFWKPVAVGVGTVAAMLALVLTMPRPPEEQTLAPAPVAHVTPPARKTPETSLASTSPVVQIRPRHVSIPKQGAQANWQAAEPPIRISIPADAVLPPGAAPEGVEFVAEVSIAADGSAQGFFVRP